MNELKRAISLHRQGQTAEAEQAYRSVLIQNPKEADALALLACLLSSQNRHDEAFDLIQAAIRLDPAAPLFRFHLGTILLNAGHAEEAVSAFQETLHAAPHMAEAHYNLGNAFRLCDQWGKAANEFAEALRLNAHYAEAANNQALVLERLGKLSSAIEKLEVFLSHHPAFAEGWLNLCRMAEKNGDFDKAVLAGEKAADLTPNEASAFLGLGVALHRLDRLEEAAQAFRRAIELRPEWAEAWDNLGQTYQFMNRLEEAKAAFEKTIEVAGQALAAPVVQTPENQIGNRHWHLALLELLMGDYANGFARYRARFKDLGLSRPPFAQPVWQGEDLNGKTILVMDEQGMGDALMLARYLPLLKKRGAKVKFLVQKPLVSLFENWDGIDRVIARDSEIGNFDFYASIFDLPFGFKTTLETLPAETPYLPILSPTPDTSLSETAALKQKIGIVWAGAPKHKHDARRSVPLPLFAKLFSTPNAVIYNLNRDMRPGDAELLARYPNLIDLVPRLNNFGDLARFVNQMDLIVTCDTATAHLAGGMCKKTFVLLPFAPDWRWLTGRDDSVWYPKTLRLFRQPKAGDWESVIQSVARNI
jgi:tetratricopeptide (TPR) repeat protein